MTSFVHHLHGEPRKSDECYDQQDLWQALHRAYIPGRPKRSPAQTPLRTVLESFPSHGSSLSKISLAGADPAISCTFPGILSRWLTLPGSKGSGVSGGISAPRKTASLLKILCILRFIRIGFSTNLDVALDPCPRHRIHT